MTQQINYLSKLCLMLLHRGQEEKAEGYQHRSSANFDFSGYIINYRTI